MLKTVKLSKINENLFIVSLECSLIAMENGKEVVQKSTLQKSTASSSNVIAKLAALNITKSEAEYTLSQLSKYNCAGFGIRGSLVSLSNEAQLSLVTSC